VTDSTSRPVRVRFAPSPTGSLHIGGLRTALFNWLFARHNHGAFILRIEDTDQTRFDPTALQTLTEALRWAGLDWDEGPEVGGSHGPYVQSERLPLYQKWANWLVENDKAYRAYETPEELKKMRDDMEARKLPPGYNRQHRDLTPEQQAAFEAEGRSYVVRLKMPLGGETIAQDAVRGEVRFENDKQQDTILLKADGFPTYHLAHVIDDHFMEISHVMRAVEWLPSLPVHWQLWLAFGWEPPIYAHLPVMLNPNGKGKMSKRHPPLDKFGNIIPVMVHDYMSRGYLPEALDNFLANIGWNFGDEREIFTMAEAIQRFDLDRINPANSAFPPEKLDWLNGEHIRALPVEELARRLKPFLEKAGLEVNTEVLLKVTPLVQTRIKLLSDVVELAGFFFHEEFIPPSPDKLPQKKMDAAQALNALKKSESVLAQINDFTLDNLHRGIEGLTGELGLNNSQLFGTLRVAVTGQNISPPLFETMEILGKETSLARLRLAVHSLNGSASNSS
jgi:glutamyl-tRNA synthetase